jgi:hypothetical protein
MAIMRQVTRQVYQHFQRARKERHGGERVGVLMEKEDGKKSPKASTLRRSLGS